MQNSENLLKQKVFLFQENRTVMQKKVAAVRNRDTLKLNYDKA